MNWCSSKKMLSWGLLALRLAVGVVFAYHGWMKLADMEGTIAMFTGFGLPLPMVCAWIVALVEFVGGIAIALGLFNRVTTTLLAVDMIVALLLVHTNMPYRAAELPLVLLGAVLALYVTGPGKFALMGRHSGACECGDGKCAIDEKDGCCGGGCCDQEEKKDGKAQM